MLVLDAQFVSSRFLDLREVFDLVEFVAVVVNMVKRELLLVLIFWDEKVEVALKVLLLEFLNSKLAVMRLISLAAKQFLFCGLDCSNFRFVPDNS